MNRSVWQYTLMHRSFAARKFDGDVVVLAVEIQEVLFAEFAHVPERQYELVNIVVRVSAHDVPKDWATANRNHRFWAQTGFLCQSPTQPTREDHSFHSFDNNI